MYLKHHEKQVEDILNYLDELYLYRIEKMEEGRINGNELNTELKEIRTQIIKLQKKQMPPKRTSTSKTPAITLAAIQQLINDGISSALKAQAASMASDSNPNMNQDLLNCLNCAEENKVAFATGTLTDNALSWWNSYAQPIGIDQAINQLDRIEKSSTDKYYPRNGVKKWKDEFYQLGCEKEMT
ncbi:hypothetical protein Tco_1474091 [Tanacetum coccineum]